MNIAANGLIKNKILMAWGNRKMGVEY